MKKEKIYEFLYLVSMFLIIAFIIILGIDYSNYDTGGTSAPFYVFIVVRTLEFVLPSIIVFVIAKIIKKKYSQ